MKRRNWWIILLVIALSIGLMAVTAVATEQEAPAEIHHAQCPFQVNPLYEDILSPEAIAALREKAEKAAQENADSGSHRAPTMLTGETEYLSVEEAALVVREKMKNRVEHIELPIKSPTDNIYLLNDQLFDIALDHTGAPTEGDYISWQYGGWSGSISYYCVDGYYLCDYTLDLAYYTNAQQERQTDTAVAQLLAELNLEGKDDYEKVYTLYQYICDNITYDYEHLYDDYYDLQYTAYAALINKTAVCQGYANLLYRLLLEVDVDCRLIVGDAGGPHAWNIIKVGDVYYNADSTWDAGQWRWSYFLQNSAGFSDHYRDSAYDTQMFHMEYPMSTTAYVDGVEGKAEELTVTGTCGPNVTWRLGRDRVLVLSGSGETYVYAYADSEFAPWKNCIDTVTVGDNITTLGTNIFSGLREVETVTLPDTLQTIEDYAFSGCTKLTEVRIPECVTEVGAYAFQNCTALKNIVFSGNAPQIGTNAFENVTATASYPAHRNGWTPDVTQPYGGMITWTGQCNHEFTSTTKQATCVDNNETTYTCKRCGYSYTEIFRYATGQHTYTDEFDTTCNVCGGTRDLSLPTTPMYRLYNPNSGEHFYTGSVAERDVLFNAGWHYEGIAWNAPTTSGAPVYRLYNPNNGDHHYTMSAVERDNLVAVGWKYEGVAWNSAGPKNLPLYRLYNPNADCGSHHYTGSEAERDNLVAAGWRFEGIGWFGMLH